MKNRMRICRAELDWTQAQLAEKIGVSRQAIVAVENGKYDPALPLAFRISRAFGKNVEEVLFGRSRLSNGSTTVGFDFARKHTSSVTSIFVHTDPLPVLGSKKS